MSGSPGPIVVRRIRATEGLLLRELRQRSLLDAPEAFGQTVREASATSAVDWHRRAVQSCRGDHRAWLLAQRGPEVVGLVHGRRRPPSTLLLFSMWVDPGSRRLGVGRELISGLEAWASRWGATETILWVFRGNRAALDFYASLGFEVVSSGRDVEAGADYGALALRRAIGPATD